MRRQDALPGGRSGATGGRREGGFTLVELVVSMLLFVVVVSIAAELLGEAQQMLVDAGREALDPAAALIAMRLRADVQGASAAVAAQNPDLSCAFLELSGQPPGPIFYRLVAGDLVRSVLDGSGAPLGSAVLLHRTTSFRCATSSLGGPTVVLLDYGYRRSRTRRSPLMLVPGLWAPALEAVHESLILTPRGAGLGASW
ncbi:MAG TPA: prepilin-type N-terminal cleavage/methylation domain-containing protein [Thermoanaerobaculia bacterium]|nr:prepilin-type N-terminal cleavage/methylation domain-containing protein [Thermoanaerobaculia bacterium]